MPAIDRQHYRGDYARRAREIRAAADADPGTTCWRCGKTARPGDPWQAGHLVDGDRLSPLAAEHRSCNAAAGQRLSMQSRRTPKLGAVVVLVIGPPASGKTTHVAQHRGPDDVVVDWDALAQALGHSASHGAHGAQAKAASIARRAVIAAAGKGELGGRTWVIASDPAAADWIPHTELVVMDPGLDVVLARQRAIGRPEGAADAARRWAATTRGEEPRSTMWSR